MRKFILKLPVLLVLILNVSLNGFSASVVREIIPSDYTPTPGPDYMRAAVFAKLSAKQFETVTGNKLTFTQRIYFKLIKRKLKRDLKKNPDLLITNYYDPQKAKFKFDFLWFVIAGIIGPLGVLLAYTYKQRKGGPAKKDVITSAWLGFAGFVLWFGFIFLF
ncbi:MAG: hypothetical protein ABJA90_11290 [Ginsengibacter sp.]